jgi:hypothetical protein
MIKRVVTITSNFETLGDRINDFIKNDLKENEYVVNIKYMKDGSRLKPYEENQGIGFETVVIAIVHIGEINNESS